jgi:hypothetical protein
MYVFSSRCRLRAIINPLLDISGVNLFLSQRCFGTCLCALARIRKECTPLCRHSRQGRRLGPSKLRTHQSVPRSSCPVLVADTARQAKKYALQHPVTSKRLTIAGVSKRRRPICVWCHLHQGRHRSRTTSGVNDLGVNVGLVASRSSFLQLMRGRKACVKDQYFDAHRSLICQRQYLRQLRATGVLSCLHRLPIRVAFVEVRK